MTFVFLTTLAAVWIVQASGRVLVGDFDWKVLPLDGYPTIAFDGASETKEVIFKYNFTGVIGPYKLLSSKLLDRYCNESADSSLAIVQNVSGNEMEIDLDIVQDRISQSRQYSENAEGTRATIDFCLRVDYNYKDPATNDVQSITFHETSVVISVDLTANFTLESIRTNRTASSEDQADTALDYPVEAYFCNEGGDELAQPALKQGSALQFCVRTPSNVTADVFVDNILEFSISQPGSYPVTTPTKPIVNGLPDALTDLACELGVCNVKHQLSSKWFAIPIPEPLPTGPGSGNAIDIPPVYSEPPSSMPSEKPTLPAAGGGGGGGGDSGNGMIPPSEGPSSVPSASPSGAPPPSGGGSGSGAGGGGAGPEGGENVPPMDWSYPPSEMPSGPPSTIPSAIPSSSIMPTTSPASVPGERQLGVPNPKPLRIDGVAVLALGVATASPTATPGLRRLTVPIRGVVRAEPHSARTAESRMALLPRPERLLAESDPPFELEVALIASDELVPTEPSAGRSRRLILLVTLLLLFTVLGCLGCTLCRRRQKKRQFLEERHKSVAVLSASDHRCGEVPGTYHPPPLRILD